MRMKMQLFESGAQLPPIRRRVREKERVQTLLDRWNTEAMSNNDFVNAIKWTVHR